MSGTKTCFFHIPRYLSATEIFTCAEHGAYMLLLIYARTHGSIPICEKRQSRIAGLPQVTAWRALKKNVLKLFKETKDRCGLVPSGNYVRDQIPGEREMDISLSAWRTLRAQILKRDNYRCHYCGTTEPVMHCDHVVPLASGGLSRPENLVAACRACNCDKGSRTPDEWGWRQ